MTRIFLLPDQTSPLQKI